MQREGHSQGSLTQRESQAQLGALVHYGVAPLDTVDEGLDTHKSKHQPVTLGFLVAVNPSWWLGPSTPCKGPCFREDRRDKRAANCDDLTVPDVCHSRLCFAMVLGFTDPQSSMHRRADRLPFCPGIRGRDLSGWFTAECDVCPCCSSDTLSQWPISG